MVNFSSLSRVRCYHTSINIWSVLFRILKLIIIPTINSTLHCCVWVNRLSKQYQKTEQKDCNSQFSERKNNINSSTKRTIVLLLLTLNEPLVEHPFSMKIWLVWPPEMNKTVRIIYMSKTYMPKTCMSFSRISILCVVQPFSLTGI